MGFKWSEVQILSPRPPEAGGWACPTLSFINWRFSPLGASDACTVLATMNESSDDSAGSSQADLALLRNIERGMAITADLTRSDLLLLKPATGENDLVVVAQAQPHSISSLYSSSLIHKPLASLGSPLIMEGWRKRRHVRVQRDLLPSGAPIVQDVYPIFGQRRGIPIAVLSLEISLIQLERHGSRHESFKRSIEWLKCMCMQGELANTDQLTPFSEWDALVLVDPMRRITYLSGIANNFYRRLGYLEDLRGKRLSFLNTGDDELVATALRSGEPIETEGLEGTRTWIRKVIPILARPTLATRVGWLLSGRTEGPAISAVLITVHDATEERRKKQELKVKTTMIQEVHHRVKNNLQTVAAMLRMQARRAEDQYALQAINEAISRILSVAVIHEFLSRDERQSINIRDVSQRIITQNRQVAATPGTQIGFSLDGPNIYLPSQQATACALVVNELIQNAMEHGFEVVKQGAIRLSLVDDGDHVHLEVWDDGDELPADFDLASTPSLGLQIVRTLVQDDLHGELTLTNRDGGVSATISFPKLGLPEHAGGSREE
jgi:two-component system, sensor histidine kinase PdtaS